MMSTNETNIELLRKVSIINRAHSETLTAEKCLTQPQAKSIISSHPNSISRSPIQIPNFSKSKKLFRKSIKPDEILLLVLNEVISSVQMEGLLEAWDDYFSSLKVASDNIESLFNDICIACFFIRNQALENIYGEDGAQIEVSWILSCSNIYGEYGFTLYDELKRLWLMAVATENIPHLAIANKIYVNSCQRVGVDCKDNPLLELVCSDILVNTLPGIWLKMRSIYKIDTSEYQK